MGKSNAERQAEYRRRHLYDLKADLARLSMLVSATTKSALERLALHHGLTQRQMLERALTEAERRLVADMPSREQEAYFERRGPVTV